MRQAKIRSAVAAALMLGLAAPAAATGALIATDDAGQVAAAIGENDGGVVKAAEFVARPAGSNAAAIGDSNLATFPLDGGRFGLLSTGDALLADDPNASPSTSTINGGSNAGHGEVNDVVTLRLALDVPADLNCLTFDFRLLSEEFPEYIGSQFNDGFVAELDRTTFTVAGPGDVQAPDNFAIDENGKVATVNTTGTSADNALGTTYDGATTILRATTPLTPGAHDVYMSVYDAEDSIFDTSVFVDNLRFRNAPAAQCSKGALPTPSEGGMCQGRMPTVIAADGVATGTKGPDVILGSKVGDLIRGRGGDDIICGRGGKDEIKGGRDDDTIQGNNGRDEISGRAGDDDLRGNKRADVIRGNAGDDLLRGKRGGDEMYGGPGEDECHGGPGSDSEFSCESG